VGFSLTGTHVIFFITSVIIAGAAVTTDVSTSLSDKGDRVQEQLDTDFAIINDPNNIPTSGSDYLFYLKNIGGKKLATTNETFQLLIDGDIVATANYNFTDSYIQPSEYTTIYVEETLSALLKMSLHSKFKKRGWGKITCQLNL